MATYTASVLDRLTIYYIDADGDEAHSSVHIDAGASDANCQALVAAFQALTDLSIDKYERSVTTNITGQAAASAQGTGHEFASTKADMRLLWEAGADSPVTKDTLFGPKESVVTLDDRGNFILNLAASGVSALVAAAIAVMVDTKGTPVTLLKDGRMEIKHRKR